jgi:ubiquinone/menaquinone biosynthesis C-methylase UbiE
MNPFVNVPERANLGPGTLEMALPLIETVGIQPGTRILEVGSGSGQVATILAKHWNVTVFTLEPWAEDGCEHIQERVAEAGVWDKVIPLKLNVQDLPFAASAFDAVISINSFEMIGDDRPQALAQMIRVTKPGGYIGIAEPMCHPVPISSDIAELDRQHNLDFQYYFRTIDWNCDLFKRSGLVVTYQSYFPEALQWWRDYADEGKISLGEQNLIRRDSGHWLSLGMVVGRKLHTSTTRKP